MHREELRELLWIAKGGLDPVSLDGLKEEAGYDPPEDTEEDDYFWLNMRRGLEELPWDSWTKKLSRLDSSTLSRLVWVLEEKRADAINAIGEDRYRARLGTVQVIRHLQAAREKKKDFIRVSDYLHVLDLRASYKLSNRAIARILKVDESKIRRWDKRAKELGVTPEDWDVERLRQIVKPSKRAPP